MQYQQSAVYGLLQIAAKRYLSTLYCYPLPKNAAVSASRLGTLLVQYFARCFAKTSSQSPLLRRFSRLRLSKMCCGVGLYGQALSALLPLWNIAVARPPVLGGLRQPPIRTIFEARKLARRRDIEAMDKPVRSINSACVAGRAAKIVGTISLLSIFLRGQ